MIYKLVSRLFVFIFFVLFIFFVSKNYFLTALITSIEQSITKRSDFISDVNISNLEILSPSSVSIEEIIIVRTNSQTITGRKIVVDKLNVLNFFIDSNAFYSSLNIMISNLDTKSDTNKYKINNLSYVDNDFKLDVDFVISNNRYIAENLKISIDHKKTFTYNNSISVLDQIINISNVYFDSSIISINDQIFNISRGYIICDGVEHCSFHLDSIYTSHDITGEILFPTLSGAIIIDNIYE